MEKMGTLKKNGDQKINFGPHGDQSPQMGTNVGAVCFAHCLSAALFFVNTFLRSEKNAGTGEKLRNQLCRTSQFIYSIAPSACQDTLTPAFHCHLTLLQLKTRRRRKRTFNQLMCILVLEGVFHIDCAYMYCPEPFQWLAECVHWTLSSHPHQHLKINTGTLSAHIRKITHP